MTNQKIDPELVDDREVQEAGGADFSLPEYDSEMFEVSDDFEYVEDDEDGS